MLKPDPAQLKAECMEKLNILITMVESGEVTEILLYGILDQEKFDYCLGVSMMSRNVGEIISHEFLRMLKEGKLKCLQVY